MKERLDTLLVERGFFPTREKARASIMSGVVFIDQQRFDKPGTRVDIEANINIKGDTCPYVSRGGLKLEKAMEEFSFDVKNKVCMDMGASTGGFTYCMLQREAKKVYAVDVGYGQLDYKLRMDPRVINMEKTNIRHLDVSSIEDDISFISIDVSFISLKLILPVAERLLSDDGKILCLVKPQFEAGRDQVGKKGIVRNPEVHIETLTNVISFAKECGLYTAGLTFSPIKGAKGNIEYLLYLSREFVNINEVELIEKTVVLSHHNL